MKKKHRDIDVDGVKYAWSVVSNMDGTHFLSVWRDKKPIVIKKSMRMVRSVTTKVVSEAIRGCRMKNVLWAVQGNILNVEDTNNIIEVCQKHGYKYRLIDVIPFTDVLPNVSSKDCPTIFYGGTFMIDNVHKSGRWEPGAFFDRNTFNYEAYDRYWGDNLFNHGCIFTTIRDFTNSRQDHDKLFFLRPIDDLKEFAGTVMKFGEVVEWDTKLRLCSSTVTPDTRIIASEAYNIAHEWRLFIVDGKISSGSHYRSYGKLEVRADVPEKVIEFANKMIAIWTPADVFVMDVGESGDELYVIECNCFNSSGFYASDIEKIVVDITNFIADNRYGFCGDLYNGRICACIGCSSIGYCVEDACLSCTGPTRERCYPPEEE